jgi:ribosome-binding factor A
MNATRKVKIESEIIRVLGTLLVSGKVKDPRIGIVSLHKAELSNDMSQVKIWVTSYCSDEEKTKLLKALKSASSYFQHVLGENLKLRVTPRLQFIWDENYIKSLEVNQLIDSLAKPTEQGNETS